MEAVDTSVYSVGCPYGHPGSWYDRPAAHSHETHSRSEHLENFKYLLGHPMFLGFLELLTPLPQGSAGHSLDKRLAYLLAIARLSALL